jgi:hypothetical protein
MTAYSERTGRARSTFAKANTHLSFTTAAVGISAHLVFPRQAGRLRRIKHVRGELTANGQTATAQWVGWYGWFRWPQTEILSAVDLDFADPRLWRPMSIAYLGNFPRSYPLELMAVNVTDTDDVYLVLYAERHTGTLQFGAHLIWDEEQQVRL